MSGVRTLDRQSDPKPRSAASHTQVQQEATADEQVPVKAGAALSPAQVVSLQRVVGNQGVQRMLAQRTASATPDVQRTQFINEDLSVVGNIYVTNGVSARGGVNVLDGQLNAPTSRIENGLSAGYIQDRSQSG